jgi:hypothetical protein
MRSIIIPLILLFIVSSALNINSAKAETINEDSSIELIRKKAEQGDATAQNILGMMYANGQGMARDDAEAVKWWRKAAEQNNMKAQFNLGLFYNRGEGVSQSNAEAIKWWRKAAAQGYEPAQNALTLLLADNSTKKEKENSLWRNSTSKDFPIYDVAAFCKGKDEGCNYRQQNAYDQSRIYWKEMTDDNKDECLKYAAPDFQPGLYEPLLLCVETKSKQNYYLNLEKQMQKPFHY